MRRYGCRAQQRGDQVSCVRCGFTWDANDPEPPQCKTEKEIRREIAREKLAPAREILSREGRSDGDP